MFDVVPWSLLVPLATGLLVAGLMTRILVLPSTRIAGILGAIDVPNERHHHRRPTPRLGGVALAIGIVLGVSSALLLARELPGSILALRALLALFLAMTLVFLSGIVDDLAGLSSWLKLQVQVAAASVVIVALGWSFETVSIPGLGPIHLGPIAGSVLTVVWIVSVINAINWIDGMDGLEVGVTTIIAASLGIFALAGNDAVSAIICAAVVGAGLAFLRHNRAPARIVMGDSGRRCSASCWRPPAFTAR